MKVVFRYRCRCCGARRSLPRLIEEYQRLPKCRRCGSDQFRFDKHRNKHGASEGRGVCRCDGYHFPHRKGGGVWCRHHPVGPAPGDIHPFGGAQL